MVKTIVAAAHQLLGRQQHQPIGGNNESCLHKIYYHSIQCTHGSVHDASVNTLDNQNALECKTYHARRKPNSSLYSEFNFPPINPIDASNQRGFILKIALY